MSDTALDSLAVVISSIAVLVAVYQTAVARRESRTTVAITLYKGYLDSAISNPKFALVSTDSSGESFKAIQADRDQYIRYDFYVSSLLFAAESILEIMKHDESWIATLRDQMSYHREYLQHDEFDPAHYSEELRTLIKDVLSADQAAPSTQATKASSGS